MSNLHGKCGNNCGKCPLHITNLQTIEDKEHVALGLSKYINWNPTPEKLKQCYGCQNTSPEAFLYIKGCRVRKCAQHYNLTTCAQCSVFPCEEVPKVSLNTEYRDKQEIRLGETINEKDYNEFIEVYEGIKHLKEIRKTDKIIEIVTLNYSPRVVAFPERLDKKYRILHDLISNTGIASDVPYVMISVLKNRRRELLKTLYAFGTKGEKVDDGLELSSKSYYSMNLPKTINKLEENLAMLKKYELNAEIMPVKNDYLTPTGGLRPRGWKVRIRGNDALLNSLYHYSRVLEKEYGNGGFRYFSNGNMKKIQ
jgi:hypothetical protein